MFAGAVVPFGQLQDVTVRSLLWLGLSGVTTALSWVVVYYRALKLGEVSNVALIDKGSVVVALFLSWWLLNESLTPPKLPDTGLIGLGLVVISRG